MAVKGAKPVKVVTIKGKRVSVVERPLETASLDDARIYLLPGVPKGFAGLEKWLAKWHERHNGKVRGIRLTDKGRAACAKKE